MSARLHVLIVDSSPFDVGQVLQELGLRGYRPAWRQVETAEQMREALTQRGWDVVLSEQALPAFAAVQALALLRQFDPDVPFIVLTGALREGSVTDLLRSGASDYLLKGHLDRLGLVVERALREAEDRRARRHAQQEAARLAAVVRSSGEAIVSQTLGGVVTSWNPAAEQLFGWSAGEVIGREVSFLVPPDRIDEHREVLARVRQGECVEHDTARVRKDGVRIDVAVTHSPVRDAIGELIGTSEFARDVTDQKALEQRYRQAQRLEAIGKLAGGIAHDFNNPLTVINGHSELLLHQLPVDDPRREQIAEIHRAGEQSASLTRQLLAFSRQQVVAATALDLNAVVADAEKLLRRLIGEDVRLETDLRPDLGHVSVDPGQMTQVLLNLAVNARDAMPQGGSLTIRTGAVDLVEGDEVVRAGAAPGTYVMLSVSDSGRGMSPEVKARIFEPFFTTKETGVGTGLGLSVVRDVLEEIGGHVRVDSEPDVGTTFEIYLPRAAGLVWPAPSAQQAPGGTETVLLVEDDGAVRALARRVLADSGYVLLEALSGGEALRVAAEHQGALHLLLTDVVLQDLGGRQLAERVLAIHPEAKVLYFSGYTEDAVVQRGVLREEVQFLQKPFSTTELACKVREVLDG